MKTKIFCLLVALVGAVFALASCGETPPPAGGNGDYNWNKTTLIFELSENTSQNELSSEVHRYYAGDDYTHSDDIDDMVADRNELAETTTNVDIRYTYVSNDGKYGWGSNVERIHTQVYSGAAQKPDMYCNFAYDLTCSSIKGSFANLYSTSYGEGRNFFEFTKEDYNPVGEGFFDSEAGGGYFFDYMKSLSLSDDKLYCLASNYCTDLVRAFLVVPVNNELIKEVDIDPTHVATSDLNGDGQFTIADFYELVWGNEEEERAPGFTYDALAKLSGAVYFDENGDGERNYGDQLGFAAGTNSGLTASGLLYTTSVKIITKTPHTNKDTHKEYEYSYPATNEALGQFADALNNLFSQIGVVTVNGNDVARENPQANMTELEGIRTSFAGGQILFGGVIAVGSLEDTVYQDMRDDAGFGVAPVPLYKASTEADPQEYQTLVHNIARIVAISATTTKFEQCSAFLNYQSTNSSEIINEYYTEQLGGAVDMGEAADDNVKMLTYIRNHVRDCFDKTYDDMVSKSKAPSDPEIDSKKWHMIFNNGKYQVSDIRSKYDSFRTEKEGMLEDIIDEWKKLEN